MKRLLLPLLAAIALPTAVNAETFYLKCTITKSRGNPDKPFRTFEKPVKNNHQFTLNEDNQSAIYFRAENGISTKIDNVNFSDESIDMSYQSGKRTISINRVTGEIFRQNDLGFQYMQYLGYCKKSRPRKTLF